MPIIIVQGAQYGDEGKGKIVDLLALGAKYCCRVNGGPNAGHTVKVDKDKCFKFKQLPSGAAHPHVKLIIGSGCVLDTDLLYQELCEHADLNVKERLIISDETHLILEAHKKLDEDVQESFPEMNIWTTKRGVGPCYATKALRIGMRAEDVKLEQDAFIKKHDKIQSFIERMCFTDDDPDYGNGLIQHVNLQEVKSCVKNVQKELVNFNPKDDIMIIEVAQGCLLDIDNGAYPHVTSSNCQYGSALSGLGIPSKFIETVVGTIKMFTTRSSPFGFFPTEIDKDSEEFSILNAQPEIGINTGVQRRIGWLDMVSLRHSLFTGGFTSLAITKFDIIGKLKEFKICVRYYKKGDKDKIPITWSEAVKMNPDDIAVMYKTFKGWPEYDISGITQVKDLPLECREFLKEFQEQFTIPIIWIGVGPLREQIIWAIQDPEPQKETQLETLEE